MIFKAVNNLSLNETRRRNGAHYHWKVVQGCGAVMDPFFQASQCSQAYQFTINEPLICTPFSILRKNVHFQRCFCQNFSSEDTKFQKFHS